MSRFRWIALAAGAALVAAHAPAGANDEAVNERTLTQCVIFDEASLYQMLQGGRPVRIPELGWVVEAGRVEGRRLIDVRMKRYDPRGRLDLSAKAEEIELRFDLPKRQIVMWVKNGELWNDDWHAWFADRRHWYLPMPSLRP